jgi:hypothetical protein
MAGTGDDAVFENVADPDLPFITVGQASRIRSLVRTAFAENGPRRRPHALVVTLLASGPGSRYRS